MADAGKDAGAKRGGKPGDGARGTVDRNGARAVEAAMNATPREGKYSQRMGAMYDNASAANGCITNPAKCSISYASSTPVVKGGLDAVGAMYVDQVMGAAAAAQADSHTTTKSSKSMRTNPYDNYYESYESTNLMTTLNIFLIP